ncbi:MAG: OmpA family protein [Aureispira sp.]|nr:OmpA family protein [Aureispira sp.]
MKKIAAILILFVGICFQITAQDDLKGNEEEALLKVTVTNMDGIPRPHDWIVFEGLNTHNSFSAITNGEGAFSILLPEGDTYEIKIKGLGAEQEYSRVQLDKQPGIVSGALTVRYEPAKKFILDDVHFNTGKATLKQESFPALDELAEVLKLKNDMRVEIAGHTDNVGEDDANLTLSQSRAKAVVDYLAQQGISKERLLAKGYGEMEPIATNDTPEGRQQNRRTEARILADL